MLAVSFGPTRWVEVLELKNGSVRILPLKAVAKIYIPRRKNEPQKRFCN